MSLPFPAAILHTHTATLGKTGARFLRSNELITVQGGVARRAEWIPA